MQLEQQENFTIHGPQLEILGEVETKLPAPAKKRGTASIVLVALALVSVLGIGGAKLKGVYRETAEIYTSAQDEYGHSIQGDFEAQADAAANLIKQAGYVDSTPAAALQEAEDALAAWNDTDDSPAVQYAANRRLYNAVDTLYASLNNKVDDSTQRALDDQYNAFCFGAGDDRTRRQCIQPLGGGLRENCLAVPGQSDLRFVGCAGTGTLCYQINHDNKGKL